MLFRITENIYKAHVTWQICKVKCLLNFNLVETYSMSYCSTLQKIDGIKLSKSNYCVAI